MHEGTDSSLSPCLLVSSSPCHPSYPPPASPVRLQPMKSYDVIREAVREPGVKAVAAALKVSPALVYKWCEQPAGTDDPEQSGARNPLDRVDLLYQLTKDIHIVRYLCNRAGGFYC